MLFFGLQLQCNHSLHCNCKPKISEVTSSCDVYIIYYQYVYIVNYNYKVNNVILIPLVNTFVKYIKYIALY